MKVTFDTNNKDEVIEVSNLIQNLILRDGYSPESKSEVGTEPEKEESIPKPTPKPKSAPKPKPEPKKEETKPSITLADLKESAKNAVSRTSREDVKKVISEFAEKLAEVAEADYGKLYKELQETGA